MTPEAASTQPSTESRRIVGVFDSGFGGLTVLRALLPRLPGTHFLYLGDTARLPYGAKSQATVARYAVEAARFLVGKGAEFLVIACNTATALALPEIRAAVPVPVIGVIEPGAQAATAALLPSIQNSVISTEASSHPRSVISTEADVRQRSGKIPVFRQARAEGASLPQTSTPTVLVLATAATVQSHAYRDTCATFGLQAYEMPCPLLVPLVEEGWTDHPVTREVLRIYLAEALAKVQPGAVLLGCTHYPLIESPIGQTLRELGCPVPVVDSAAATAEAARTLWNGNTDASTPSTFTCYATDSVEKFARLGTHFLGQPIPQVHLLDLGG